MHPGSFFQDYLPLADRTQTDILQCISASYERTLVTFAEGCRGHGPTTNRLGYGGDPEQDQNPGIFNGFLMKFSSRLDSNQDQVAGIFT